MKKRDEKAKIVSEKKKEISKKKIKKVLSNIKQFFSDLFDNIKTKYNSMNKTTKQIMFVWLGVFCIIVFMVLFVSLAKLSSKKYINMESAMDKAALNYVESGNMYATKDEKIKIPLKSLLLTEDMSEEDVAHKSCDGYSVVYYNDEDEKYIVESYISCDKYTSDFYNDY